jgi:hypothetical protein
MRTHQPLAADPFDPAHLVYSHMRAAWDAKWIGPEHYDPDQSYLFAYKLELNHQGKVRVHVSADQRYILFLDGKCLGRGPERGDLRHWMYDTYDFDFKGKHTLVAITWWISAFGPTPPAEAQQSVRPAFIAYAEGEAGKTLSTGHADWKVRPIEGVTFTSARMTNNYYAIDPRINVDGRAYPWGIETGAGDNWAPARHVTPPALASLVTESLPFWLMRPAMLPPMTYSQREAGVVRFVDAPTTDEPVLPPVVNASNHEKETDGWSAMLAGKPLTIPKNTRRRVIIDLKDYFCAFPALTVSGGRDARVSIRYAERLRHYDYTKEETIDKPDDRSRDNIDGRAFIGYGDALICDGSSNRTFEPLWWGAGRYIQITVSTADQPLTIEAFKLFDTGFPYQFESTFDASDERLKAVIPLGIRTLQMCSHETNMDCPYYEQLNYTGDTRLQSLVAMTYARNDELVRKAICLFDWSRTGDSWPSSRWPVRVVQTIPPFAMWWVAMVYDYARYRGDRAFVAAAMPGVRSIIERWRQQIDDRGLLTMPYGWNFVDWVSGWPSGVATMTPGDPCGVLHWQMVYTLRIASELETMLNEPLLAQRHVQTASAMAATGERTYYDPKRQMLAIDVGRTKFCEHAQVLALASGYLSQPLVEPVSRVLTNPPGGIPTTSIYFSHYTFEALGAINRIDTLIERMRLWFDHRKSGLYTTIESPEPTRSDCHAWGAHPLYHYFATILGIQPGSFGFERVVVQPRLGPLEWASGEMVHPKGTIKAEIRKSGNGITGQIVLPESVAGELRYAETVLSLKPGKNTF